MPVSVLINLAALVVPLAEGDPRSFQRVRKTPGVDPVKRVLLIMLGLAVLVGGCDTAAHAIRMPQVPKSPPMVLPTAPPGRARARISARRSPLPPRPIARAAP
jgi:hypothetical protein